MVSVQVDVLQLLVILAEALLCSGKACVERSFSGEAVDVFLSLSRVMRLEAIGFPDLTRLSAFQQFPRYDWLKCAIQ
jgi:hypothetical protein